MKTIYILFTIFFQISSTNIYAQDTITRSLGTSPYTIDILPYLIDSTYRIKVGDNGNLVGKVMSQQFGAIISGQSSTTIGNFASITPTEGKIDFAGSLMMKNSSVLTAKLSGRATDGFVAIFENSRLNTQISVEVKYHLLNLNKLSLSINRDSGILNDKKVRKIKYEYDLECLDILSKRDSINLSKKMTTVKNEIDSLTSLLNSGVDQGARQSLIYEIEKREILKDSISKAIKLIPSKENQIRNIHAKRIAELENLSISSSVEGFKINWWTFGYKVNNNKFKLFYPTAQFSDQVIDTIFVSHEANIQWSYYNWNSQGFKTLFSAFGISFGFNDNFLSLNKSEISETNNYGPSSGSRSVTKKYNAYEGVYNKDLVSLKLYSDMYYYLFNNNIAALHFNPELLFQKSEKPITNCFAGILLAFMNKGDEKSIVNAELYYQFLDIFKNTETKYNLFERNTVGLRFTFPINFKYKS
ncbi:MAG: hypothetical protein JNK20_13600 [Flavipsychrobacter sp.]|nr:hypothetical protein [Flavipsychrobacter sp.]